jgi:tetratricopeptide (TPR) repeat protein
MTYLSLRRLKSFWSKIFMKIKTQQIIILVAVVVVAGILFSLPKGVVKPKQQATENAATTVSKDTTATQPPILADKTPLELPHSVQELEQKYNATTDKTQKIQVARQLAGQYNAARHFDKAAPLFKFVAENTLAIPDLLAAGDAYFEVFNSVADLEKGKDWIQQARAFYQLVLDKAPENSTAKIKLALSYVASEAPMQGIKMLLEVVEKEPENQEAMYQLGILSIQSGQYDKAVKRLEKLVELNPQHAQGHFYLGMSYAQLGDKVQARQHYEAAKKIDNSPSFIATIDSYLKEIQ